MVAQQTANWEQTEGYEKTETILQSNPEITGIICGNDTMAVGAAEACKAAGRTDIKIIGVDGSDEAAALIRAGEMTGTALQQCALNRRNGRGAGGSVPEGRHHRPSREAAGRLRCHHR